MAACPELISRAHLDGGSDKQEVLEYHGIADMVSGSRRPRVRESFSGCDECVLCTGARTRLSEAAKLKRTAAVKPELEPLLEAKAVDEKERSRSRSSGRTLARPIPLWCRSDSTEVQCGSPEACRERALRELDELIDPRVEAKSPGTAGSAARSALFHYRA